MKKILFLTLILSATVGAFDFSQADQFFAKRENNPSAIASAKALYQQALDTSSNKDEILYAMEQFGKLSYYEGDLLTPKSDSGKRVEIFSKCMDNADKIQNIKPGAFYYWKTACMALWGKSANWFSVAWRLSDLKDLINKGLALGDSYEGGGMERVVANIQVRSPSISGLLDYNAALLHINSAIAKGPQYYGAYIVKAEILKALGRENEGVTLLEATKRDLETRVRNNQLPKGLEPESKMFLLGVKAALAGN